MSLRKSPNLTPALLASQRRNAAKSTGPRIARGKAWSRPNRLQHGWRSPEYVRLLHALLDAARGSAAATARTLLASQPMQHPLNLDTMAMSIQVEREMCDERQRIRTEEKQKKEFFFRRSKPE